MYATMFPVCSTGSVEVISKLLDAEGGTSGAHVEAVDAHGLTAFIHSALNGHIPVAQVTYSLGFRV